MLLLLAGAIGGAVSPPLTEASASRIAASLAPAHDGRARVVHVWATWCRPCVAEMPSLLQALRKRRERLHAVFISLDTPANAAQAAKLLAKSGGVPGESLRAAAGATSALFAFDPSWRGDLPTTWLLAPDGRVLAAQRDITELQALLTAADRKTNPKETR